MSAHRLDPVFRPRSIAIVGASQRAGAVGNTLIKHLQHGGYRGSLYPVNARYQEIEGYRCYPSLSALPEVPEHVAIAVPNAAIEETPGRGDRGRRARRHHRLQPLPGRRPRRRR